MASARRATDPRVARSLTQTRKNSLQHGTHWRVMGVIRIEIPTLAHALPIGCALSSFGLLIRAFVYSPLRYSARLRGCRMPMGL